MSIIPEDGLQEEESSLEAHGKDSLPYKLEIDGFTFTREELGGQHKIPYRNSELNQIALLPNPVKFNVIEDKELQIDVWEHNGERYKVAGLPTADQRFDENGNLIDSGYTTGTTEVNGEYQPFLRCYFNPHLRSIEDVESQSRLYEDKREEIIDTIITLDHLKREGEIATAENTADWEEIAGELDVVCKEDIPLGNGKIARGGGVSSYTEVSMEAKNYLNEEFRRALIENRPVQCSRDDLFFKNDINPRELVLKETGLPSSADGLLNAIKYNDKTGDIVVSDLGECVDAVFSEEKNSYEVRFDSVNEFANYHGINSDYKNRTSAALD